MYGYVYIYLCMCICMCTLILASPPAYPCRSSGSTLVDQDPETDEALIRHLDTDRSSHQDLHHLQDPTLGRDLIQHQARSVGQDVDQDQDRKRPRGQDQRAGRAREGEVDVEAESPGGVLPTTSGLMAAGESEMGFEDDVISDDRTAVIDLGFLRAGPGKGAGPVRVGMAGFEEREEGLRMDGFGKGGTKDGYCALRAADTMAEGRTSDGTILEGKGIVESVERKGNLVKVIGRKEGGEDQDEIETEPEGDATVRRGGSGVAT